MNGSSEPITCIQGHGGTIGDNKLGEGLLRAVFEDPFEGLLESVAFYESRALCVLAPPAGPRIALQGAIETRILHCEGALCPQGGVFVFDNWNGRQTTKRGTRATRQGRRAGRLF